MSISKQHICMLQAGDVIRFESIMGDSCYTAVLEHEGSKLVLSAGAKQIAGLRPIRTAQWEYLVVDDVGNVCDKDGKSGMLDIFEKGTVLPGRAIGITRQYRSRIMPNMKMVQGESVYFVADHDREHAINLMNQKIRSLVFNNDYNGNIPLMLEMFARLVKGIPPQELPWYLAKLFDDLGSFARLQQVVAFHDSIAEMFSSEDEVPLSAEAQEAILAAQNKTP